MTDPKKPSDAIPTDLTVKDAVERYARVVRAEASEEDAAADSVQEGEAQMILFKGKEIRQVFHDDEWYFSVVDVISAVTETSNPSRYWTDLKRHLSEKEGFSELYDKIVKLGIPGADGRSRASEMANVETMFRIVQSIRSPKAEPFKRFLARVGYERIQEIQNPEIAIKRALLTYKVKGYSDEWINARVQTIASRKELTREWQHRGIAEGVEFAILTDAISKETFGLKTKDHHRIKGLKKSHGLRDHMTPLELALTMLGETTTAEMARTTDAQGFQENKRAAIMGGKIAGGARKNIEQKLGKLVVSRENYLPKSTQQKLLPGKS